MKCSSCKTSWFVGIILTIMLVVGLVSWQQTTPKQSGLAVVTEREAQIMSEYPPERVASNKQDNQTIVVEGYEFDVWVVDEPQERTQGLSGTRSLTDNQGMLFVFDRADTYSFWMKDMLLSLDILWLDENGRVVHIADNVSPESFPQSFTSPEPAWYVLEVRAGQSAQLGIEIGSIFDLVNITQ